MRYLSLFTCALVAPSLAPAFAQNGHIDPNVRYGMAAGWSLGVSFDANGAQAIRYKDDGPQSQPPVAWPASRMDTPDYALDDFVSGHPLADPAVAPIEIDAMTSGRSVIPSLESNESAPNLDSTAQGTRWLAITVSIDNDRVGSSGGRFGDVANPGSDLVTFYQDPKGLIDPQLHGTVVVEATAADLGIAPGAFQDVDALDWAMGVLHENRRPPSGAIFRQSDYELYFSVTPQWISGLPSGFTFYADGNQTMQPPHPGDVYRMRWSGTAWEAPQLFLHHTDLGMSTATGDVDALDFDNDTGVIIYSATIESGLASQLMVATHDGALGLATPPKPLAVSGTGGVTKVTSQTDVTDNDSELDGLCTFDPEWNEYVPAVGLSLPTQSWAAETDLWNSVHAGISVMRLGELTGPPNPNELTDGLRIVVSGWGHLDADTPSFVQLYSIAGSDVSMLGPELPRAAGETLMTFPIVPFFGTGTQTGEVEFFATIRQEVASAGGQTEWGWATTDIVRIEL